MRIGMAVFGCLFLLAGCQRAEGPATDLALAGGGCTLKVGWDPYEPYQYQDADGTMRGMDVEIVRDLAQNAGCNVSFTRGAWKDLLAEMKDGSIDVLMAATVTPDREAYAAFSPAYRRESFVVLTRAADATTLGNLDLDKLVKAGKHIGITDGYYYGDQVTAVIQGDESRSAFVLSPVAELNYTRLVAGELDALIDDPNVAAAIVKRKGLGEQVMRSSTDITSGDVSFMFSKKTVPAARVSKFNEALVARRGDGSLERLIARYQGGLMIAPAMGGGRGVSALSR
jgi:polar amino acid transport system substrate-binding protein